MARRKLLEATIEPFDSFWEAPDNINKGHRNLGNFNRELLADQSAERVERVPPPCVALLKHTSMLSTPSGASHTASRALAHACRVGGGRWATNTRERL
jgi:hypothetical protein